MRNQPAERIVDKGHVSDHQHLFLNALCLTMNELWLKRCVYLSLA